MDNSPEPEFALPVQRKITSLEVLKILLLSFFILFSLSCFFIALLPHLRGTDGTTNQYAGLAQAFLEGRADVAPVYSHDIAHFQGKQYVIFPPFPAVLLMPLIEFFGTRAVNTILVSLALSIMNGFVLWHLLKRLGLSRDLRLWTLLAFFLGTSYWFALTESAYVWFFAHLCAVSFLLLALYEAHTFQRPLIMGLLLSASFLSRQMTIFAAFYLVGLIIANPEKTGFKKILQRLLVFGLGLGVGVFGYLAFNYARFGNILDSGYSYLSLTPILGARVEDHGLFSLAYLPFNSYHFFVEGFHIVFQGRGQMEIGGLNPFGVSILAASPFVVYAFAAKDTRIRNLGAWLSIGAMTLGHLLYYNNGWVQKNGQRFSLDFLPILILLCALGASRTNKKIYKALIVWSVCLNILAFIVVPDGKVVINFSDY